MRLDIHCGQCAHTFAVHAEGRTAEVLDQVVDQGPWGTLGDGETLEDHISTALSCEASLACPECGEPAQVTEESLSLFARELLLQW